MHHEKDPKAESRACIFFFGDILVLCAPHAKFRQRRQVIFPNQLPPFTEYCQWWLHRFGASICDAGFKFITTLFRPITPKIYAIYMIRRINEAESRGVARAANSEHESSRSSIVKTFVWHSGIRRTQRVTISLRTYFICLRFGC